MTEHTELTVLSVLPAIDPEALGRLPPRERVFALEEAIQKHPRADLIVTAADLPTRHFIANGVYVRELFIPKDTVGTGRIHKYDHVAIISGDISVYDEHGMQRLTGPHNTFTSKAGIKRAAYAHEDTLFTTVHRMSNPDETDIDALEREFFTYTYEDFDKFMMIMKPQEALP